VKAPGRRAWEARGWLPRRGGGNAFLGSSAPGSGMAAAGLSHRPRSWGLLAVVQGRRGVVHAFGRVGSS